MPTYAYRCRDCGHELEVHQGFADAALTECPVCGGALRKQYGTVGVTFNGSGFYRTDSRAADAKGGAKSDSSGSSGGSSGASSGGDAKSSSSGSGGSDGGSSAAAKPAAAKPAAGTPAT